MSKYCYTVDDEEPNCGRCDHINDGDKFCARFCGADHGWNEYQRTEEEEDDND